MKFSAYWPHCLCLF